MQVILSVSDGWEFEEAMKAKSCQAINAFRQLIAPQSPLFVIDDHGLYMTWPSEEPSKHWPTLNTTGFYSAYIMVNGAMM